MKKRDAYLNQLIALKDKSPIKVITGVRRCGKSSLLDLYEAYLLSEGVAPAAIVRMNFESLEFDDIREYRQFHDYVVERISGEPKTYVLLDEVQMVDEWERAVNSLRLGQRLDIYITGSNGHLLASELSSLLSGRYFELHMLPLSFKEFLAITVISRCREIQPDAFAAAGCICMAGCSFKALWRSPARL